MSSNGRDQVLPRTNASESAQNPSTSAVSTVSLSVGTRIAIDVRPAREDGLLDLADDAGLPVLEAAAPLVDEKAGLVFLTLRLQRLPQESRTGDDIVGEALADGRELGRPGPLGPGQEPELARHPRRGAEFEAVDDETARGHQAARSRPISSTAEAASGA